MYEIVLYFIGAFSELFDFINFDWRSSIELSITFAIVVSCCSALTLTILLLTVKNCLYAMITLLRGA